MKIAITTLGCKVNQSESASIEGRLRENGHEIVPMLRDTDNLGTSRSRPDVCIVNTCTVTAKSDYQSRQFIRRAVKTGAKVIATGCYAQLSPDELAEIQGVGLVLGNSEKHRLHEYIDNLPINNVIVDSPEVSLHSGPYFSNRSRAFLKIQDGCNFTCSYCSVPMARGGSRSLSPDDVLAAVERLCANNYKEIVLTGIHIGGYGLDLKPKSSLLEIVNRIAEAYPDICLRLTSIEPRELKKELLMLIKEGYLCPHLHIPLQSGSDNILKTMNRGYNASFFKDLLKEVVLTCPDISIGTDVIVGFPGESEKDFRETAAFLEELPLSYIHVFPYSKRQNTMAATFQGQISNEIKRRRVNIILEIAKMKKNLYITKHLGRELNVIVENKTSINGFYRAISDNYIRTVVRVDDLTQGQRLQVKLISLRDGVPISIPV